MTHGNSGKISYIRKDRLCRDALFKIFNIPYYNKMDTYFWDTCIYFCVDVIYVSVKHIIVSITCREKEDVHIQHLEQRLEMRDSLVSGKQWIQYTLPNLCCCRLVRNTLIVIINNYASSRKENDRDTTSGSNSQKKGRGRLQK